MLNTSQIMLDFAKLCLALMLNAKRLKIMPKSIIMLNMATMCMMHDMHACTGIVICMSVPHTVPTDQGLQSEDIFNTSFTLYHHCK